MFNFTVQVTDSNNQTDSQTLSIVIDQQLFGDLDSDGSVNSSDFSLLVSRWLEPPSAQNEDMNNDGIVDIRDLGLMMSSWD